MRKGSTLGRLLNRLAREAPGTPTAATLTARAERVLMRIVKRGGKPAADRVLKAVRIGPLRLVKTQEVRGTISRWCGTLDRQAPTPLEVWFAAGQFLQATHVQYGAEEPPVMTPSQRKRHETQDAFYKRYMEVGERRQRCRLAPDRDWVATGAGTRRQ